MKKLLALLALMGLVMLAIHFLIHSDPAFKPKEKALNIRPSDTSWTKVVTTGPSNTNRFGDKVQEMGDECFTSGVLVTIKVLREHPEMYYGFSGHTNLNELFEAIECDSVPTFGLRVTKEVRDLARTEVK